MKMKRTVMSMILALGIACSWMGFGSLTSMASAETINAAKMEGATYHWSGTWADGGVDSNPAGDAGSKCFDGDIFTKWGSANKTNGDQWVSVVFPNVIEISGFKVWQESSFAWTDITGFKVQIQNGTETWADVYTFDRTDTVSWVTKENTFTTPVTATALRVYVTSAQIGSKSAAELTELEVYSPVNIMGNGTGNTNKAFNLNTKAAVSTVGATAIASSSTTEVPSRAIDGNMESKWGSQGPSTPQWLQITFPNTVDMAGYVLNQDFNWSDVTAYKVEVSANDKWETVYTYSAGTSIGAKHEILFDTLWNTDTIRFTFTEVGNNAIIGNNNATTSIDFHEVVIYTADKAVAVENPITGDDTFILTGVVLTIVAAAVILKKEKYAF